MLQSFIEVAPDSDFSIYNLPYGVFRPRSGGPARVGAAIGEYVLDLSAMEEIGLIEDETVRSRRPFSQAGLNAFMELGRPVWQSVRRNLQFLLDADTAELRDDQALRARVLFPITDVDLLLPASIGDYTDFYSSREHASNVGTMFRGKENALMPNWLHLPVGYHGRASSIVVSGTDVIRPCGQIKSDDEPAPSFGASRLLDFELEVGFFVGPGNDLGRPIPVDEADAHIFGLVLVNDWSARDIQKWEYVPLGPFLSKSFATTISPWVVTLDALEPFGATPPPQDPSPLPYLRPRDPKTYDVTLEVHLRTARGDTPNRICRSNFKHLYWTMAQQLAHHTVNGCNVRPGDLMASGTISGPTPDAFGSLLELTWRGERPIHLPGGESRTFLQDGDTIELRGFAKRDGIRVGFGTAQGRVLPATC